MKSFSALSPYAMGSNSTEDLFLDFGELEYNMPIVFGDQSSNNQANPVSAPSIMPNNSYGIEEDQDRATVEMTKSKSVEKTDIDSLLHDLFGADDPSYLFLDSPSEQSLPSASLSFHLHPQALAESAPVQLKLSDGVTVSNAKDPTLPKDTNSPGGAGFDIMPPPSLSTDEIHLQQQAVVESGSVQLEIGDMQLSNGVTITIVEDPSTAKVKEEKRLRKNDICRKYRQNKKMKRVSLEAELDSLTIKNKELVHSHKKLKKTVDRYKAFLMSQFVAKTKN